MTDHSASDTRTVTPISLLSFGVAILEAIGTPAPIALAVADHLVDANLTGKGYGLALVGEMLARVPMRSERRRGAATVSAVPGRR